MFQRLTDMLDAAGAANSAASQIAVLFLDLDNFKTVNDTLGHDFGDRVLIEIGERLRQIAGETGFTARLGGDEFTLVFAYSGDPAEVERRATQLVSGFQRPLLIHWLTGVPLSGRTFIEADTLAFAEMFRLRLGELAVPEHVT